MQFIDNTMLDNFLRYELYVEFTKQNLPLLDEFIEKIGNLRWADDEEICERTVLNKFSKDKFYFVCDRGEIYYSIHPDDRPIVTLEEFLDDKTFDAVNEDKLMEMFV